MYMQNRKNLGYLIRCAILLNMQLMLRMSQYRMVVATEQSGRKATDEVPTVLHQRTALTSSVA